MTSNQCLLTIEELGALGVAFFHLFAFVSSRLHVAVGHGEHRCPRLHQELAHLHVVAGRSAVKRRPGVMFKNNTSIKVIWKEKVLAGFKGWKTHHPSLSAAFTLTPN